MKNATMGLCAICTNERPGRHRILDGKRVFVCAPCDEEHPRSGRYTFGETERPESPLTAMSKRRERKGGAQ